MITVALGKLGEISNVIDDKGGATASQPRVTPKVAEFPQDLFRDRNTGLSAQGFIIPTLSP